MSTADWPLFQVDRPSDLARYVVPDAVRALVKLPQNMDSPHRLREIWDGLRAHGILYGGCQMVCVRGGAPD